MSPLPLFQVARAESAVDVGAAWTDITRATSESQVSIRLTTASPPGALIMYAASADPIAPKILLARPATELRSDIVRFDTSDEASRRRLDQSLNADAAQPSRQITSHRFVARIVVTSGTADIGLVAIAFGGTPAFAGAQLTSGHAAIRPLPLREMGFFDADLSPPRIQFGRIHQDLLGTGWHPPERSGALEFRWTSRADAAVLVPLARALTLRVTAAAMPFLVPGQPVPTIALRVNGAGTQAHDLSAGWADYQWIVPAAMWKVGVNDVRIVTPRVEIPAAFGLSQDERPLGVALRQLTLEPALLEEASLRSGDDADVAHGKRPRLRGGR
jgi:hypothetical protein